MSDETGGRASYGSATRKKSSSGSTSKTDSKGSGAVASGGASTGTRKADSPAAWLRTPTRADASGRARSFGNRSGR